MTNKNERKSEEKNVGKVNELHFLSIVGSLSLRLNLIIKKHNNCVIRVRETTAGRP